MARKKSPHLTDAELRLMDVLWEKGEATVSDVADALPSYIDADAAPNPGGWPKGGVTRLELPNDHLQYALTWFALAVALIVMYVLYHREAPPRRDAAPRDTTSR